MEKRRLGQSELEVTTVTFGCWQAGKSSWTGVTDEDSVAAMRAALDAGINFFDTAEGYGAGHSEEVLAQALEGRRDGVLIATKTSSHTEPEVIEACEKSLRRLQTDCIDLYQIHWPSGSWGSKIVPIEETMGALVKLQQEGKIRAIGVSNFNSQQIEEALAIGRIDSLQPPFSLLWRSYEDNGTFATCRQHEIGILSYSSIAQGLLTGKFSAENRPAESDNRSGNILFKEPHYGRALEAVEKLGPIAEKHRATLAQLATAWVLAQPGITSAIVGARKPEQIQDIASAAALKLDATDLQEMEFAGRAVTDGLPAEQTNMWEES